ncbi:hypothetical protein F1880_005578 [Penicillium rolfsii]|nr:hypothetical protein F1880_005578 [Penicillium rolfsii]
MKRGETSSYAKDAISDWNPEAPKFETSKAQHGEDKVKDRGDRTFIAGGKRLCQGPQLLSWGKYLVLRGLGDRVLLPLR